MVEGYGLTETSPVISTTCPDPGVCPAGSVGFALPGVDVKLMMDGVEVEGEGELWCSGPNVMQGYWQKPDETAEVMVVEADGKQWFRTGDVATIMNDGNIKITGRIKEQYKLENGKYVAPAPIEGAMVLNKVVAQCILYGDAKPFNVAGIVPDFEVVAKELGLEGPDAEPTSICANPLVQDFVSAEVDAELASRDVAKFARPKRYLLIAEPFTAQNEMLTPKLSIRKPAVLRVYKDAFDGLY